MGDGMGRFPESKRFNEFSFVRDIIVRYKPTTQTVNNSSTLVYDTALGFPIGPGQIWRIDYSILYNSGTTPDWKAALTVPTGASVYLRGIGGDAAGTLAEAHSIVSGTAISFQGTGANRLLTLEAVIIVGVTAGVCQLQWAQNSANASDTKVLEGSHLVAVRIR